jgi:hypothetical protein
VTAKNYTLDTGRENPTRAVTSYLYNVGSQVCGRQFPSGLEDVSGLELFFFL